MTRRRLLCGLLLAAVILGAAALPLWFRAKSSAVAEAACHRVRGQMTEEEITVILGRPADYRSSASQRRSLGNDIARGWSTVDDSVPVAYESLWSTDQGSLWVQFDADGRARVMIHSVPLKFSEIVERWAARLH